MVALRGLLEQMVKMRASDLHLTAGLPPQFRVDGQLISADTEPLMPEVTKQVVYSILNDE